jgi:NAD-dependent DNA ligase
MIYASKVGPGAQIVIRRSGDVIPKLDRVLTATAASFPPADTWEWIGSTETAVHIRTTAGGDAVATAKLHHFLKTLDIPGAGPATATALVAGGIRGPAALWATSATKLSELLGPKTGAALYANIRTAATTVTEQTLMIASSVMPRGVGDTKLRALFAAESDPTRWATLAAAPTGWSADAFQQFLKELPTYLAWRATELAHMPAFPVGAKPVAQAAQAAAAPDKGLICLTGFRDKTLEETAVKRGYRVATVLTNKVTILLIPDGDVKESEKIRVSKARGTPILTRSQFVAQHLSS